MKTMIFSALALALAVPAGAQTAPAADPHAGHAQHQVAGKQGQQHPDHAKHMAEMHKHCQEMMKHHGKMDHGAKPGATGAPAAGSYAGHHGN